MKQEVQYLFIHLFYYLPLATGSFISEVHKKGQILCSQMALTAQDFIYWLFSVIMEAKLLLYS